MSETQHTDTEQADNGAPRIGIDAPVPKLPRGKGPRLSANALIRIGMLAAMLFAVIALRKPCSEGTARFIGGFDEAGDAGAAAAPSRRAFPLPPGTEYVRLRGDETEDELRKKLQGLHGRPGDAGTGPLVDGGTR